MNKFSAILVDDEPDAIESLSILLECYCPEITIVGTANCVDDALIEIEKHRPDVVFLDIEMPEKTGFDLFKETNKEFKTIFVTAYDEFAIKAFEVSAVDYLLKPIKISRLKKAVNKLATKSVDKKNIETLTENIQNLEITKVMVANNSNYEIIRINDIICIEAKGAYSIIHFIHQNHLETHISTKPLRYFDDLTTNNKKFYRTHRSWLVNIDKIASFDRNSGIIITEHNKQVFLTKNRIKEFLPLLHKKYHF